eukprot:95167-Prymnesium_polylepis.1
MSVGSPASFVHSECMRVVAHSERERASFTVNVCVRRTGHTRVDATQQSAGPAGRPRARRNKRGSSS